MYLWTFWTFGRFGHKKLTHISLPTFITNCIAIQLKVLQTRCAKPA